MLSDDLYHHSLLQLAASIKAWSGFVADVARVEIADEGGVWRFAMTPTAATACPIEIICHERQQVFDVSIAGETYEGWRPASMEAVHEVLKAVADGAVVRRQFSSGATGLLRARSTEIAANGHLLMFPTATPGSVDAEDGQVCRATHFLPYRKATQTG